jgi:putative aldouronate transport system substrate-binding protein
MGIEPFDRNSAFVNQLKNMGIERAIKITQDAFDRYNKR